MSAEEPVHESHDDDATRRLLSVFHHEAATPVALIASVLRHLQRSGQLEGTHEEMVAAAARQIDVLERLLDQVRVANEDEVRIEPEPVDLAALARELVDDLTPTVLADHPCEVVAPDDGTVETDADPAALRQVLANLLDNAARYSEPGKRIHVQVHASEGEAVLAVTDEGTGIADPDLERIFERYERVDEEDEGLGLGLFVVWRIVRAHGGRVHAEPAPHGPGTRFVVRLPARTG